MAWQDDLRELDEALSAGRIKAEEYRRRRDDLHGVRTAGLQLVDVHRRDGQHHDLTYG
ncbi:hypothetical protein ACFQ1S_30795 [Kibdelosporangium lantanae]|uniref:Uncharacterized protein n=1 Tax=Kibdelosporangium lantanae TaxID=1497396 RepID=A0ABW3MHK5_9PSEU